MTALAELRWQPIAPDDYERQQAALAAAVLVLEEERLRARAVWSARRRSIYVTAAGWDAGAA